MMPADRTEHRRLVTLAGLQRLRLAHDEWNLADARTHLRKSADDVRGAQERLSAREAEMERLLASDSFAPERLLLQSALLSNDVNAATDADMQMETAATMESERAAAWQASRHQHEELRAAHRSLERCLARKAEDRALASLPVPMDSSEARS